MSLSWCGHSLYIKAHQSHQQPLAPYRVIVEVFTVREGTRGLWSVIKSKQVFFQNVHKHKHSLRSPQPSHLHLQQLVVWLSCCEELWDEYTHSPSRLSCTHIVHLEALQKCADAFKVPLLWESPPLQGIIHLTGQVMIHWFAFMLRQKFQISPTWNYNKEDDKIIIIIITVWPMWHDEKHRHESGVKLDFFYALDIIHWNKKKTPLNNKTGWGSFQCSLKYGI